MKEPLKAGDVCKVVGGMGQQKSPNLGLQVTIKHRIFGDHGMDHREYGAMYRCEGQGILQMNETGNYQKTDWADFAGIWLERIDPKTDSKEIKNEHSTSST